MFAKIKLLALVGLFALTLLGGVGGDCLAQESEWPSVGVVAEIDSVTLPGTELEGRALFNDAPMVVHVKNVFAHGDSFRYDLRYQGFEPGEHDLSKWLVRKDGSSTDDLPEIPVKIRSVLPPGQQKPNDIESAKLPSVGGYTLLATIVAVAWALGLLGLIFIGRPRKNRQPKRVTFSNFNEFVDRFHRGVVSRPFAELPRHATAQVQAKLDVGEFAFGLRHTQPSVPRPQNNCCRQHQRTGANKKFNEHVAYHTTLGHPMILRQRNPAV